MVKNSSISAVSASTEASGEDKNIFTWDEVHKHRSETDCWMVVKGKVYDVTSWVSKHPGGDIILQGGGRDATPFFISYHPTKVFPMLKKYYIGEVKDYKPYYSWESEFYTVMKQRVEAHVQKQGFKNGPFTMYLKSAIILLLWAAAFYYGMVQGSLPIALVFGFLHSHLGISIAHDGAHGSYSRNKWLNFMAKFMIDVMGGSWVTWSMQHNVGHHPHSNRQGDYQDEDFDPDARSGFPLIRLTPHFPAHKMYRFQHLYIWCLFAFVGFKWMYGDIKYFLKGKYQTMDFWEIPNTVFQLQILTKLIFATHSIILPIYFHGLVKGVLLALTVFIMTSYNFSLNFAVNHLTDESIFPHEKDSERDWAKLQVLTSSNYSTGSSFWFYFSGGLNFQIEHHLFPYLSHVFLPSISPIVKQTCKEYNVKYQNFNSYGDAISSYYAHLKKMGVEESEDKLKN